MSLGVDATDEFRDLQIARPWKRYVGSAIDRIPIVILIRVYRRRRPHSRLHIWIVQVILDVTYRSGWIWATGATPGKRMVGISVIDRRGRRRPSLAQAVLRSTLWALPGAAGAIWPRELRRQPAIEQARMEQQLREILDRHAEDSETLDREVKAYLNAQTSWRRTLPVFARLAFTLVAAAFAYWGVLRPPRRQALHDRLAGTLVVSRDRPPLSASD
jgi:uncharacterized RDD family membrane protein YckC